jgi:hypothetical protein
MGHPSLKEGRCYERTPWEEGSGIFVPFREFDSFESMRSVIEGHGGAVMAKRRLPPQVYETVYREFEAVVHELNEGTEGRGSCRTSTCSLWRARTEPSLGAAIPRWPPQPDLEDGHHPVTVWPRRRTRAPIRQ